MPLVVMARVVIPDILPMSEHISSTSFRTSQEKKVSIGRSSQSENHNISKQQQQQLQLNYLQQRTAIVTKGSPPVRRILFTPTLAKSLASLTISSLVSKEGVGCSGTPSSGMQYRHLRLPASYYPLSIFLFEYIHLSVSEMRK